MDERGRWTRHGIPVICPIAPGTRQCGRDMHDAMEFPRPKISVVSPVYMGEQTVAELVRQVSRAVSGITEDYEIVLVEDGSPDGSWVAIEMACERDRRVKAIRLSRNFGQHYALTAGLQAARGNHVIVLDCDLQDDPRYIPDLYRAALSGFEIVYTLKRQRAHKGVRNQLGRLFHATLNFLVGDERLRTESRIGNYTLLSRRVVDAFLDFRDYHRHYLSILRWLGFDATYVEIEHRDRPYGKSSYSMAKLVQEAINGITSQTDRLLYLSIGVGLAFFVLSIVAALYVIVAYFLHGFQEGWASVFVLMLTSTGIILMSLGVTAIYVGKIFEQTKNRPLFLVRQRINFQDDWQALQPGSGPTGQGRHAANAMKRS